MKPSFPPGFFSFSKDESGAAALIIVLGIAMVLLVAGTTVASQARQELRMSGAAAEAEIAQMLVVSGFSEAAKLAEDETWPTVPFNGTNTCQLSTNYPTYCIDAMARTGTSTSLGTFQIPVRVRWQVSATSPPGEKYGWILFTRTRPSPSTYVTRVTAVRYYHTWCTYQTDSTLRSLYGPCVQGG